ncbi:MAG: hypothetical protein R3224_09960 [Balneolaceae bacterium]|nr:hypothetical protein [Balneolaceae bacterium]
MKRFFIYALSMFIMGAAFITVQAQPVLPDPPEQAPVDLGLGILAALGGAYAVKKLRSR